MVQPQAEALQELKCPECHGRLVRFGQIWSGRVRIQRYLCPTCGRSTIHPVRDEGVADAKD